MVLQGGLVQMRMSTTGKLTRSGAPGFTLFELLVVVVVLAIVAGFVIPSMDFGGPGGGVERTAGVIQRVLDEARYHARLTRSPLTVKFSSTAIQVDGGEKVPFPDGVGFAGVVFADDDKLPGDQLVVDRRGFLPVSIVRMKVDDKLYSIFINPVLREIEYKTGIADFGEFAE